MQDHPLQLVLHGLTAFFSKMKHHVILHISDFLMKRGADVSAPSGVTIFNSSAI